MWAGSWARVTEAIGRRRTRPTRPSWSSTASPSAVSQTSLSRPVAPRRRASVNDSSVFSRACARAPRWPNANGGWIWLGTRVVIDVHSGRVGKPRADGVMMSRRHALIGYHGTEETDGHADPSHVQRLRRGRAEDARPGCPHLRGRLLRYLRLPVPGLRPPRRAAGRPPDGRPAGLLRLPPGGLAPALRAGRGPARGRRVQLRRPHRLPRAAGRRRRTLVRRAAPLPTPPPLTSGR